MSTKDRTRRKVEWLRGDLLFWRDQITFYKSLKGYNEAVVNEIVAWLYRERSSTIKQLREIVGE